MPAERTRNPAPQPLAFAPGEGYAPTYLASKHRISVQQACDLLAEIGPDRERLNLVATKVRLAGER